MNLPESWFYLIFYYNLKFICTLKAKLLFSLCFNIISIVFSALLAFYLTTLYRIMLIFGGGVEVSASFSTKYLLRFSSEKVSLIYPNRFNGKHKLWLCWIFQIWIQPKHRHLSPPPPPPPLTQTVENSRNVRNTRLNNSISGFFALSAD